MPSKYNCKICKYKTDKLFCYKQHLNTKKHMTNTDLDVKKTTKKKPKIGSDSVDDGITNVNDNIMCEFCSKTISHRNHIKRHHSICKAKFQFEERNKIIMEKNRELEEKNRELELKAREIATKDDVIQILKEEHNKLHSVVKSMSEIKATSVNIMNDNRCKNYYYVQNNFKNAHNYEDLIDPPLTMEEIQYITEVNPTIGCANLLNKRCIDGLDIDKRPFHSLDLSRNKFVVKIDDEWIIDQGGNIIFSRVCPQIEKAYPINTSNKSQSIKNLQGLTYMKNEGKKQITKNLHNTTNIKNPASIKQVNNKDVKAIKYNKEKSTDHMDSENDIVNTSDDEDRILSDTEDNTHDDTYIDMDDDDDEILYDN